jgi:hypothetical protein
MDGGGFHGGDFVGKNGKLPMEMSFGGNILSVEAQWHDECCKMRQAVF